MIQATNELILGIEMNAQYAQVTYYHQSVREPLTLETGEGPARDQLPMALRQDADGQWHFWDGELKETDRPDIYRISDIYGKIERRESLENGGISFEPDELLGIYFHLCMDQIRILTQNTQIQVMVTVNDLNSLWSDVIIRGLERCKVDRKRIYVQDFLSSFYYFTVNQKKELWYQDVALLTCEEEKIVGYVLHIDKGTRPAIARVDRVAEQPVDETVRAGRKEQEWMKEKDRLFFELLKKVFERRNVNVSYLVGDYFSKTWAERSVQYLCYKRHAFQGKNLFSKGACYAAMERAGLIRGREILFSGRDMIEMNIGMEMNIRGKESYYPMVSAGINWYEAHHTCEFILNNEREIRLISRPMTQGDNVMHFMRLPGLPERENRSTRVRLTVYFSAPSRCHVEIEDLGFGGLVRSSGMSWSREILF